MNLQEQLMQVRESTMARMPQKIINVFEESLDQIRKSKLKENALGVGDQIPDLPLFSVEEIAIKLSELHHSEYLVLNFYRGGWCPYCNLEMRAYEALLPAFKAHQANVIAISAEIPDLAVQTATKNQLSFPVLTDKNATLMKAIGIVFSLDEASKREYKNFGMDLTRIHGNEHYELPVPAVYVIDRNREIVFRHFEEDYMTRIEPQEILNFIKKTTLINN